MKTIFKSKLKSSIGIIGVLGMMTAGIGAATAMNAFDDEKNSDKEVIVVRDGLKVVDIKPHVKMRIKVLSDDKGEIYIDEDGNERSNAFFIQRQMKMDPKERAKAKAQIKEKLSEIEQRLEKLEKKDKKSSFEYEALEMARDALKESLKDKHFFYGHTNSFTSSNHSGKFNKVIKESIEHALKEVKNRKAEIIIMQEHLGDELTEGLEEMEKAFREMEKEFEEKNLKGTIAKSVQRSLLQAEKQKMRALERAEKHIQREMQRLERRLEELERQEQELASKKRLQEKKNSDAKTEKSKKKTGTTSI
ncbi:hypothetical protein QGN29_13770 [Temperatibacter marinus]|uniref:Uncharacterized protein n=1 Tax=Temperatibacter marinus TaxID=1456591 RepID=A0AA52HAD1_9PROT|nr:hypothetical protein [Temperatibacter marinus]WND02615.1 hypothetical protein QGN29_13770 [Temperatibacter marinus]